MYHSILVLFSLLYNKQPLKQIGNISPTACKPKSTREQFQCQRQIIFTSSAASVQCKLVLVCHFTQLDSPSAQKCYQKRLKRQHVNLIFYDLSACSCGKVNCVDIMWYDTREETYFPAMPRYKCFDIVWDLSASPPSKRLSLSRTIHMVGHMPCNAMIFLIFHFSL